MYWRHIKILSRPKNRRRSGSAVLEFSLLLPILLMVGLLSLDFGRFAHFYIAVTNAARAGASYAIMHPVAPANRAAWDANVRQAVVDELSSNGWFVVGNLVTPAPVIANDPPSSNNNALGYKRITVDVSYAFQPTINWTWLPGYTDTQTLRRVVVVRVIR